jgi:hypothetical protein
MVWLGCGIGSRMDLSSVGTHHAKQLKYVEPQKEHFFHVAITIIIQLRMLLFGYIAVN